MLKDFAEELFSEYQKILNKKNPQKHKMPEIKSPRMKWTASLFSQIVNYENLRLAWLKARKRCALPRPGNASRNYECP